jgi:uncharacterized cupredoxin-like copper-binding protein
MKPFALRIALLLIANFALAACGSGGASTAITVTMTDFQFSPNIFTVPAGALISVEAANNGAVVHDFVVMNYGATVGDTYDEEDLPNVHWKIELQAGESLSTSFTAPSQPGEYQVICGTKGHFEAGMIARMIVVAE